MKMQGIFEALFDVCYLLSVVILGILMIRGRRSGRQYLLFGLMAVTLGAGDAFHLIPRAFALLTDGLERHAAALGTGKFRVIGKKVCLGSQSQGEKNGVD